MVGEPRVGGGIVVTAWIAGKLLQTLVIQHIDVEGSADRRAIGPVNAKSRIDRFEHEAVAGTKTLVGRLKLRAEVGLRAVKTADAVEVLQQRTGRRSIKRLSGTAQHWAALAGLRGSVGARMAPARPFSRRTSNGRCWRSGGRERRIGRADCRQQAPGSGIGRHTGGRVRRVEAHDEKSSEDRKGRRACSR